MKSWLPSVNGLGKIAVSLFVINTAINYFPALSPVRDGLKKTA